MSNRRANWYARSAHQGGAQAALFSPRVHQNGNSCHRRVHAHGKSVARGLKTHVRMRYGRFACAAAWRRSRTIMATIDRHRAPRGAELSFRPFDRTRPHMLNHSLRKLTTDATRSGAWTVLKKAGKSDSPRATVHSLSHLQTRQARSDAPSTGPVRPVFTSPPAVLPSTSTVRLQGSSAQDAKTAPTAPLTLPPLCQSILACARTLWLAPHDAGWPSQAPTGVRFMPPTTPKAELIAALRRERPDILVVGDQRIDADVLHAWQEVTPHPKLVRRGSSTDLIDLKACGELGVEVRNEPGLNAPFVARFMLARLRGPDGRLPDDMRLLGAGEVGRAFMRQYLAERPDGHVTVLVREGRRIEDLQLPPALAARVSLTADWDTALCGATAVGICTATNDGTRGRITARHVAQLGPGARIACVAKPDCLSDGAVRSLATSDATLMLDYGLTTLNQFRERLGAMGLAPQGWCELSFQAMADPVCRQLMDHAAAAMASTMHLDQMVRQLMAGPAPVLRTGPAADGAPAVSVIGAGINGLMQAMFSVLLLGAQVTVHGQTHADAGPSHNQVNMRHCSPTETTLKQAPHEALTPYLSNLVIALNCAGITLWQWLLEHNPTLRACAQDGLKRLYPQGQPDETGASLRQQTAIANAPFPGADTARPASRLTAQDVADTAGIPGIGEGLSHSGLYVWIVDMMAALRALLEQAGTQFRDEHLSPQEQEALIARGQKVIGAMGLEQRDTTRVLGWFIKLLEAGGEGPPAVGVKLHYPLRVGVMNCGTSGRDGQHLNVSGGFASPDLPPEDVEAVRQGVLAATKRHFPASWARTEQEGALEIIACNRPMGDPSGISFVGTTDEGRIDVGQTVAGGTTQATVLAMLATALMQHLLTTRAATT
jgi:hypothetical protein